MRRETMSRLDAKPQAQLVWTGAMETLPNGALASEHRSESGKLYIHIEATWGSSWWRLETCG